MTGLMKKILAAACCLGLLAGCAQQGEAAGGETMKEGQSVQTVVDQIADEIGIQMPADVDDTILKDMFYLDASEVESYAGKMAMTMTSADNVLAVQAKSGQADAAQEALEQRLADVQNAFAQYLPDQSEKAQKGQVVRRGDYVFLLILGQSTETYDSDMERAIQIIDDAF